MQAPAGPVAGLAIAARFGAGSGRRPGRWGGLEGRNPMTILRVPARFAVPLLLGASLAIGACAKKAPEPVPVTLTPHEQACVDRATAVTAADPASISIIPTTSTKTGDMVYAVTAGAVTYNCVVAPDNSVSSFSAVVAP
jgi:hypothetical protein